MLSAIQTGGRSIQQKKKKEMDMGTVIGIDLGTSTTEAAVICDGKPVMVLNPEKEIITPSAVGLDSSGNWVVGSRARAQYLLSPENTAI